MGKSFVMKRSDGSLAGYLMQDNDGMVCFRAHALPEEGAKLTLIWGSGMQTSRTVSGERESAWSERGGNVEAAFVSREGKLLMSTGEQGQKAYEAMRERDKARRAARLRTQDSAISLKVPPEKQAKASGEAPDKESERTETELCETGETAQAAVPAGHALPERRWPPPPCMPEARYEKGRWQT